MAHSAACSRCTALCTQSTRPGSACGRTAARFGPRLLQLPAAVAAQFLLLRMQWVWAAAGATHLLVQPMLLQQREHPGCKRLVQPCAWHTAWHTASQGGAWK